MKAGSLKAIFKGQGLLQNSFWGVFANILQNLFLGLFFVLLARSYSIDDFADYLVANTLYQLVASFSTMGLGQWFTREVVNTDDKQNLVSRFLKLQIYFGVIFYLVNSILSTLLYNDELIIRLSLFVGINILFDNFIYAIRSLNVAENKQKNSFLILLIESALKLLLGGILVLQSVSIEILTILSVLLRIITLNLFVKLGSSNLVNLRTILKAQVNWQDIKSIVVSNWVFVIIGSVSVVYWRIANIIISKMLTSIDVANFEICFKLFSIAQIIPVIFSATVFPKFVKLANDTKWDELKQFYNWVFYGYLLFSILSYTFIVSFGDFLLPWMFGEKFVGLSGYMNEMFLTILLFPTALLQANLLVAVKLEKYDMILNVVSLVANVLFSFVLLNMWKDLSSVNYSIFLSFFIFHLLQDIILLKRNLLSPVKVIAYYVFILSTIAYFNFAGKYLDLHWLFLIFWALLFSGIAYLMRMKSVTLGSLKKRLIHLNA